MRLRKARRDRGWTQEQLAEASGIDQTTISMLELGRIKSPSFDTITRLARALGVDAHAIVPTMSRRQAAAR